VGVLRDPDLPPETDEVIRAAPSALAEEQLPRRGSWITRKRLKWATIGLAGAFAALVAILLITAPLSK